MSCHVITISRTLAAGGEQVGRLVAEALGFRYLEGEIVVKAAEKAGVSPEAVARAEQTPGLFVRVLEAMARNPASLEGWVGEMPAPLPRANEYEGLIEGVIREAAREGKAVIVAHGASIPLAGTDGLLRVLVTASPEVRAQRLVSEAELDERAAAKAVADSDGQRRSFLQRFYHVDREQPTHYDLVVNTDVLTAEQAAQAVLAAAKG